MRTSSHFLLVTLAILIAALTFVESTPVHETGLALLRKDETAATTDLAITSPWDGTTDVLDVRVSDAVLIEIIKVVPAVVDKVCANPWVCALAIVAACFAFYFYTYAPSDYTAGPGVVPTRRDIQDIVDSFDLHPQLRITTPDCDFACQLERFSVEGEWTHIGQTVTGGRLHDIHHYKSGTTRGVRVAGLHNLTIKRATDQKQTQDMIGDYYWESSNQKAYNSFHSNSNIIQSASEDVTQLMQETKGIEACVVFKDSDGDLANGLFTLGWNGQPFKFSSQSALNKDLGTCYENHLQDGRGAFFEGPVP